MPSRHKVQTAFTFLIHSNECEAGVLLHDRLLRHLKAPQWGITVRVAQNVPLLGPFSRELLLFAAVLAPCKLHE
jgi:hypothetical protein